MLAYAFRYFRFNIYEEIKGEKFENNHDLFSEILIRGVSYQIKQGLYKTYVNKEGNLSVIRGRIDILKTYTIQRTNPFYAYCNYDELSENNPYNQIVKTTLQFLLKCTNVDESRKNSIRNLLHFFDTIDLVNLKTINFERFSFDRNNQNYRMLLNICRLIFENMLMTTEGGNYKLRSLSDFQMSKLFEKFVLEYYRMHHPEAKPRASQISWSIKNENSALGILPRMQTDVMLTIGDRTLIIDTKYYSQTLQSNFDKQKIHSNNLYQIYTYVTEQDKERVGRVDGMLLYAKTQEDIVPDNHVTMESGNKLFFRTLDLNQDFYNISQQLDNIVNSIPNIL
ncbi:5-methylcytosine-specific restriction endonuclease system specificity protein McrC [Prevotella sp. E13-27]|nr:5-methylcytosine-specific restriction endonuclease system specificity protein McrC [Prevotella sp. E13-27]